MLDLLQSWIDAWKAAKAEEEKYKELRWQIEEQIFDKVKDEIAMTGTYNFGDMQIIVTEKKDWDQKILDDIYEQFEKKDLWPCEVQWKINGTAFKALQEMHPEYASILYPALTIKRNKPTFKIKE